MINRIPPSYTACTLRNVTPACPQTQCIGVGFDAEHGGVVRVNLSVADAAVLCEMLRASIQAHKEAQAPRAQVTLTMLDDGRLHMWAERMGRFNAAYADGSDGVLAHIPALLQELRDETADVYTVTPGGAL